MTARKDLREYIEHPGNWGTTDGRRGALHRMLNAADLEIEVALALAITNERAAIDRVRALHVKVTRWGDDEGEYSLDQEDYDDSPEDHEHLNAFDVCAECFRIEQSPEQHGDGMPHAIFEGLWPCATRRTLDGGAV